MGAGADTGPMPPQARGSWLDEDELRADQRGALRRAAAWCLALVPFPAANLGLLWLLTHWQNHDGFVLSVAAAVLGELALLYALLEGPGGRRGRTARTLAAAAATAAVTLVVGYAIAVYLVSRTAG
jgi:hypothetical protein